MESKGKQSEIRSMTRRKFIACGLAGCIAAQRSPASFVRSGIAHRHNSINSSAANPVENPYIEDGLVAMWDGEWNSGWGRHNDHAKIWKNLMGDSRLDFTIDGMTVGDNFVNSNRLASETDAILPQTDFTIEVVGCNSDVLGANSQNNPLLAYGADGNNQFGFGLTRSWALMLFYCYGRTDGRNDAWPYGQSYEDDTYSIPRSWSGQSAISGGHLFYKNGVAFVNGSWRPRQGTYYPSDANSLKIGYSEEVDTGWSGAGAKRTYYCIRFYNRCLFDDEVKYNYNIDAERFGWT